MRRSLMLVSLPLALLLACRSDPEVEVTTRLGEADPLRPAPELLAEQVAAYQRWLSEMPRLALSDEAPASTTEVPPNPKAPAGPAKARTKAASKPATAREVPLPPPHPPRDPSELTALVEALRRGPIADLAIPARNIALADPALWPQLRELLLAERRGRKADYKALLDQIGGDVPNRYGHFDRAWKRAHGSPNVLLSDDWHEDLLALPTRKVATSLHGIYRDTVLQTSLLRASARIARERPERAGEVIEALLDAAYIHEGTFRDEVGRTIRAVGDDAIPHLVRASARPPAKTEDDRYAIPYRRAEYAELQLDRLDRLQPRRALLAVQDDPRRLSELLTAYGDRRVADAADVLLDHVQAPLPRVRAAARAAVLAFVTGPPPPIERKTLNLLGGKTTSIKARPSYRETAALALRARLAREAPGLLEEPCRVILEGGAPDPACLAQPERHALAYFDHLDRDQHAHEAALIASALERDDLQSTVTELDRLLVGATTVSAPIDPRILDVYRRAAEQAIASDDPRRAGQLFRKAAVLLADHDPQASAALTVQALLAEASLAELSPEGKSMLLATAETIAPGHAEVGAAIAALRSNRTRRSSPPWSTLLLTWALALATLTLLATLGARLRAASADR
jgi:hypothetical protein